MGGARTWDPRSFSAGFLAGQQAAGLGHTAENGGGRTLPAPGGGQGYDETSFLCGFAAARAVIAEGVRHGV